MASEVGYPFLGMVVLYFLYGLAFFLMGFAILGEALRPERSRLAFTLTFLAAYGLIHGPVEWLEMMGLVASKADVAWAVTPLETAGGVLLPISLVPLVIFGIKAVTDNIPGSKALWLVLPSLLFTWLLAAFLPLIMPGVSGGAVVDRAFILQWQSAWARYLLYLPGSLLAALGLLSYSRRFTAMGMPNIARYATIGAFAFLINAAIAGLVVHRVPFPPAQWINNDSFTAFVGVPPQVFRATFAVVVAISVVLMLRFFRWQQYRKLEQVRKETLALKEQARKHAAEWNVVLEKEVKARTEQIEALGTINVEISRHLDIEKLLNLVVQSARHLLSSDVATISLLKEGELVIEASSGTYKEGLLNARLALGHGLAGKVVAQGQPLIAKDYVSDLHITHELDAVIKEEGLLSLMAIPLKIEDRTLGAICVASRTPRDFGSREIELLSQLGLQASIALENAKVHYQRQEMGAVSERERLAREIHDSLAQSLGMLRLQASQAAQLLEAGDQSHASQVLKDLDEVAEKAYVEVREAILDLRTAVSVGKGLVPTLRDYLATFGRHCHIETDLVVVPSESFVFPLKVEIQLIRILQESLTNVRKHARASRVMVTFTREGDMAKIVVEDNGKGFDMIEAASRAEKGFGLYTMKERAESVGGKLRINSTPGAGSSVSVWVPLEIHKEVDAHEYNKSNGR